METISQDGTNIKEKIMEYQIFVKATITSSDGKINIYHLTHEEYVSLNTAIEEGNTRWRFIRISNNKQQKTIDEWLFFRNVVRISFMETLYEDGKLVKTRPVIIDEIGEN